MVKCKDCQFCNVEHITSYSLTGMFEISVCKSDLMRCKVVDAGVDRECLTFVQPEPVLSEVNNATKSRR